MTEAEIAVLEGAWLFHLQIGGFLPDKRHCVVDAELSLAIVGDDEGNRAFFTFKQLDKSERAPIAYTVENTLTKKKRRFRYRSIDVEPTDRMLERARKALARGASPKSVDALLGIGLSLREVAELLKVSHEKVRQLQSVSP